MDFEYSPEEKAFQHEVRAFIAEHATPDSVADPTRTPGWKIVRRGRDCVWLGPEAAGPTSLQA